MATSNTAGPGDGSKGDVWKLVTVRYDIHISAAPWLTWNGSPSLPEIAPKLGWMMESVQIDPFDSGHFMYGTGATIYGADNLTDWDSGGTVRISVRAQGLEETSIGCVISPPVGPAHLFSGVGDVGGFRHTDLNKATKMYDNPTFVTTPALDYAELAPHTIVRVGNPTGDWTQHLGISTDSGDTWTPSRSEPSGATDPESTTRPSPSAPTAGGSSGHRRELRPAGPTTTEPPGRRRRGCRPGFRCAPTG
ncbi:hypothetical protein [Streptomyces canus]|uniref:hypothetical protein n=1 Tax=Streptomyces canus TaxID=58343 RepID=UPI002E2F4B78|nr:hypothetical protein [Streptomyces canus]